MSNIKDVCCKPKQHDSVNLFNSLGMADKLCDAVIACTRPQAIPLTMMTMRKATSMVLLTVYACMTVSPIFLVSFILYNNSNLFSPFSLIFTYDQLEDRRIKDIINICFLFLCYMKQKDSMLPCFYSFSNRSQ